MATNRDFTLKRNNSGDYDILLPTTHLGQLYSDDTLATTLSDYLNTTYAPKAHATNGSTYGYASTTDAGHIRIGEGLAISSGTVRLSNHGTLGTISSSTTLNVTSHSCRTIRVTAAATITIPVNTGTDAEFAVGTHIDFIRTGAGDVTFTPASGVTLYSESSNRTINAQYQAVTLIKYATNIWYLIGALKA